MDFIAVLNYEQLDNGFFLTSFAKSLARKKNRGIILHSDSAYTERIIQTGVMREDAQIRAMKDLNHRLVALFADQGVSAIGINGYQKSAFRLRNNNIVTSPKALHSIPKGPMLLISGLIAGEKGTPIKAPLPDLALAIQTMYNIPEITLFSKKEHIEIIPEGFPFTINPSKADHEFKKLHLPEEFYHFKKPVVLQSPASF